ncbi:Transcriptional regulatory protein EmbR [Thalassoglobus neptunius]|uniref:Transcriptional regulatory protein EmbR n=1 Tax=Thalassoglobus neptunius TaxID=1938619 RepID=A0A5C5X5F0_9PLAN|nr:FHA domain-containing protein [Thalassoglobus neptunius]TWT57445.1 Transcriptional regulatory protein EmbR [Thalassoglobus neptunius]
MILVPLAGGAPIHLAKAVMFIGRGNECDIVLKTSRKVSRKHCCIAQIDDTYLIRDLGSMNGVRVNEASAKPELPLNHGDEVWVGDVGFRFQAATAKRKVAPAPKTSPQKPIISKGPVSTEFPRAIPEESDDFIIEQTGAHLFDQLREVEQADSDSEENSSS